MPCFVNSGPHHCLVDFQLYWTSSLVWPCSAFSFLARQEAFTKAAGKKSKTSVELDLGDMLAALEKHQQAMKARQLTNTKPLSFTGIHKLSHYWRINCFLSLLACGAATRDCHTEGVFWGSLCGLLTAWRGRSLSFSSFLGRIAG